MARAGTPVTSRARETFLKSLAISPNVSAACRAAKFSRKTAYNLKADDPVFSEAWDEVIEASIDELEIVARDRALRGESDKLMEILLKAHRPEKYVEKRLLEHSGPQGGAIRTETALDVTKLSSEALAEIMAARRATDAG